ncbi:hypothetical protein [Actinomadura sp. 3N407]|uniref:hypothetical protein n=1 Tax=Actinomadura sp. 3N407 TaxID=3457423 RepID=UPI003FCC5F1C
MTTWWAAFIGPGAFLLIMGGTMLITRVTEPRRRVPNIISVASARQMRTAERYIARLEASGRDETIRIKFALTGLTMWLRQEATYGPNRHRLRRARQLEYWETRLEAINHRLGLPTEV